MNKGNASSGPGTFSPDQGNILLKIARHTIAEKLGYELSTIEIPFDQDFQSERGTFVTLKIDNELRGCIGNLSSNTPVYKGIANNAINAAFHDHRFSPLTKEEFEDTEIEISILTEPEKLYYDDGNDLISKLRPNIDGVIIRKGGAGATFLPQVWEQLPDPITFLEQLSIKAGLSKDSWQSADLEVSIYQVQYFEE